jgi:hypothetical protein
MKTIIAKFKSKCFETGRTINKGDTILYNYSTKKVYCMESNTAKQEKESQETAQYIDSQENAYFDNFCYNNNI